MADSVTWRLLRLVAAVVVMAIIGATGLFAARSGVIDRTEVRIRNESPTAVYVYVLTRSGTSAGVRSVPPWFDGMCPAARWDLGLGRRPGSVVVIGLRSDLDSWPTYQFQADDPYYVRIDARRVVHTGEPIPPDVAGCEPYLTEGPE